MHQNYVEALPLTLALIAVNGQERPAFTAGCTAVFMIGRALYAAGYTAEGPKGRRTGALVGEVAQMALLCGALVSAYKAAPAMLSGLKKLLGQE